jgi:predicted nucleic acid-binding protein
MTSASTSSSAAGASIVDTNVLLYAQDRHDPAKRAAAERLVADLLHAGRLHLTAQVLNEFYWNATRTRKKRPVPLLTQPEAATLVRHWCGVVPVLAIGPATTLSALAGVEMHGLSFWDALIWATAKMNGVPTIYTEDFQHGREVEGVRFINPFLPPPVP